MKIYIAADHAGFAVKEKLKQLLEQKGMQYEDLGTDSEKPVDYPDYAATVAKKVTVDTDARGILICGTGTGMVIAANKVKGIRAVVCYDAFTAHMAREHNNANILCLRGRDFPYEQIEEIVGVWLTTPYSGDIRHEQRLDKITALEQK